MMACYLKLQNLPRFVHMAGLSESQLQQVGVLRKVVGENGITLPEDYNDDWSMDRWLTAWDGNIQVIVPKLQQTLQFRKAMQFDNVPGVEEVSIEKWDCWIRSRYNSVLIDYYPSGICGYAKNGDVVVIEPIGRVDPKGLAHSVQCSEFMKLRLVACERIRKMIVHKEKQLNHRCGLVYVIDSEGLSMDQLWMTSMQIYLCLITLLQDHFPDMLNHILVIKAPSLVQVAYRMISPVLSKKTKEKLQIIADNKWQQTLLEFVGAETLPVYWGGTFTTPDNDPHGYIKMGGKVPTSLYLPPPSLDDMRQLTVARGSKVVEEVGVESDKDDRLLHWRFHCPSGDLYVRIYYKTTNDNEELLMPRIRINTEFVVDEGSVSAPKQGIVILEFDNNHSYVKSKSLFLSVRLV